MTERVGDALATRRAWGLEPKAITPEAEALSPLPSTYGPVALSPVERAVAAAPSMRRVLDSEHGASPIAFRRALDRVWAGHWLMEAVIAHAESGRPPEDAIRRWKRAHGGGAMQAVVADSLVIARLAALLSYAWRPPFEDVLVDLLDFEDIAGLRLDALDRLLREEIQPSGLATRRGSLESILGGSLTRALRSVAEGADDPSVPRFVRDVVHQSSDAHLAFFIYSASGDLSHARYRGPALFVTPVDWVLPNRLALDLHGVEWSAPLLLSPEATADARADTVDRPFGWTLDDVGGRQAANRAAFTLALQLFEPAGRPENEWLGWLDTARPEPSPRTAAEGRARRGSTARRLKSWLTLMTERHAVEAIQREAARLREQAGGALRRAFDALIGLATASRAGDAWYLAAERYLDEYTHHRLEDESTFGAYCLAEGWRTAAKVGVDDGWKIVVSWTPSRRDRPLADLIVFDGEGLSEFCDFASERFQMPRVDLRRRAELKVFVHGSVTATYSGVERALRDEVDDLADRCLALRLEGHPVRPSIALDAATPPTTAEDAAAKRREFRRRFLDRSRTYRGLDRDVLKSVHERGWTHDDDQ